nr:hypothetical protein [uncultured Vibrio sp.]
MNITPYKNGIHSLAEGLNCLQRFLECENNPYLMKEVVLKVHHGLETLLKDLLFQRNPVFLLVDKTTVTQIIDFYKGYYDGKNSYLFDDAKTITPEETINRIRDLKIIFGISNKDFQQLANSFKTLNAVRNQLQHFAIKANPDEIIRVLGNLVPRTVKVLKAYYRTGGRNEYQPRVEAIPHQALPGMEQLFGSSHDINADLNAIFPEATEVLNQLEVKYDSLLNEAVKKLQGFIAENMKVGFKLRDHGHVGAPPYIPEITLEGWLNEKFESHRNSTSSPFGLASEDISATYDSSLIIEQPQVLRPANSWHDDVQTKLSIRCESTIDVKSNSFFNIPELNDYLPFIKSPTLNILMEVECISTGMFNDSHYDIRTVNELKGSLKIELTSSMYGDPIGKPSVFGVQEIFLNVDNTSLRFHAFVESNKKLRNHHSLELSVEDTSSISFKKP